jgi:hypothetical protein
MNLKILLKPLRLSVLQALILFVIIVVFSHLTDPATGAEAAYQEDYNGEGYVNAEDVIFLIRLGRADPEDSLADYNGDGLFRIDDALAFLLSIRRGKLSLLSPVVIQPEETDETLLNPGRGFATSFNFNEDVENILYPDCSIAHFSWHWDELEPEEGQVNYSLIDSRIDLGRANGQK